MASSLLPAVSNAGFKVMTLNGFVQGSQEKAAIAKLVTSGVVAIVVARRFGVSKKAAFLGGAVTAGINGFRSFRDVTTLQGKSWSSESVKQGAIALVSLLAVRAAAGKTFHLKKGAKALACTGALHSLGAYFEKERNTGFMKAPAVNGSNAQAASGPTKKEKKYHLQMLEPIDPVIPKNVPNNPGVSKYEGNNWPKDWLAEQVLNYFIQIIQDLSEVRTANHIPNRAIIDNCKINGIKVSLCNVGGVKMLVDESTYFKKAIEKVRKAIDSFKHLNIEGDVSLKGVLGSAQQKKDSSGKYQPFSLNVSVAFADSIKKLKINLMALS